MPIVSRVSIVRALLVIACVLCLVSGQAPTVAPSRQPSRKPTRKPTNKPVHIYGEEEPVLLGTNEKQGIVSALTILLFILMAMDFTGPEVLFLIALMILCLAQILSLTETLSGFSNESMITIGALFLVIGAVEKSHVVDWFARKTFGANGSDTWGKFRMYVTCFSLSTFFNNTPLVAILMPVVKDWGRMRNISASQLLIPLSYAVLSGSYGSMIGTSSNLTVQGLMQADRGYSFTFFAPMPIGIVCFVALCIYMLVAGPYLLPKDRSGLLRKARDEYKEFMCEVYVSEHSSLVGKNLASMMNALGMSPNLAIKIRRHDVSSTPANEEEGGAATSPEEARPAPVNKQRSVLEAIQDVAYLQENVKYWYSGPSAPDRLGAYTPVEGAAAAPAEPDSPTPLKKTDTIRNPNEYFDIISPSVDEIIRAGDVVFVASAQVALERMMKSILGESQGLYILQGNVMSLPGYGSELAEMVLSDSNPLIGRKVSTISTEFSERYKAAIITVRPKDFGKMSSESITAKVRSTSASSASEINQTGCELTSLEGRTAASATAEAVVATEEGGDVKVDEEAAKKAKEADDHAERLKNLQNNLVISDHILSQGDTVLAVTNRKNLDDLTHNHDFFVVSGVGLLPQPLNWFTMIPVLVFVVMLVLVACQMIEMCPAALTVAAFFLMGRWLMPTDIPKYVDLRLLMLLGCSLSFAKAMTTTGLAIRIASTINSSNPSPFGALLLIYAITLVITELISNNAAGALMYPIAVALADEMGLNFKAFAMCVMIACTAGFVCPTGYQTHVMVWGPGGYKFGDFVIFGIIPDLIYWFIGCAMITQVFPLNGV